MFSGDVGGGEEKLAEVEAAMTSDTGSVMDVGVGSWWSCGCREEVQLPVVTVVRLEEVPDYCEWTRLPKQDLVT